MPFEIGVSAHARTSPGSLFQTRFFTLLGHIEGTGLAGIVEGTGRIQRIRLDEEPTLQRELGHMTGGATDLCKQRLATIDGLALVRVGGQSPAWSAQRGLKHSGGSRVPNREFAGDPILVEVGVQAGS